MIRMKGIEKGYAASKPVRGVREKWSEHRDEKKAAFPDQRTKKNPGGERRFQEEIAAAVEFPQSALQAATGRTLLEDARRPISGLPVLRGVNLHIRRGDYAAIVGPSGSGKSTLMHILGVLDTPDAGEYRLDGVEVSGMNAQDLCMVRRDKIGFVFQGFQLLPRLTALENVAFPLMLRGIGEEKRLKLATRALENVGLGDRLHHKPGQLSGGQQQRVALARALSYEPKLLLCDEPTGALDEQSRDEVLKLFAGLHHDGHTVVVITHDMGVAAHAMRKFLVENGRVREM